MATRREQLEIGVIATDGAGKILDNIADKATALDGDEAKVVVDADDQASEKVSKVRDDVTGLNGDTATVQLSAEDRATREVDEMERRLSALTNEEKVVVLAAEAARLQREVEKASAALLLVDGKTAEAILTAKDDASAKLDAVNTRIDTLGGRMQKVGVDTDNTRSVVANFAGNMASELPGAAQAFGPLNMAIGQFAEYATEGNIRLSSLVKAAGPLALAVAGFTVLTNVVGSAKAEQKAYNERVEQMSTALDKTRDPSRAFLDVLRETGDILQSNDLDDSFLNDLVESFNGLPFVDVEEGFRNISEILDKAGVSYYDYNRAVNHSGEASRDFIDNLMALADQGVITEDELKAAVSQMTSDSTALGEATAEQARQNRLWTHDQQSANDALQEFLDKQDPTRRMQSEWTTLTNAMRDGSLDTNKAADALSRLRSEFPDLTEADIFEIINRRLEDEKQAATDAEDATRRFGDALQGVMDKTKEGGEKFAEGLQAALGVLAGGVGQQVTDAYGRVGQAIADAKDDVDSYTGSLEDQAAAFDELADKQNEYIGAADSMAEAQQRWNDGNAAYLAGIEAQNEAIDSAERGSAEWTAAVNTQRDSFQENVELLVGLREAQAAFNGEQFTATDRANAYNEAVGMMAATLHDDTVPQIAAYYEAMFRIPTEKRTEFEMLLAEGDQIKIRQFIEENSGTFDAAFVAGLATAAAAATRAGLDQVANPNGQGRVAPVTAQAHTAQAATDLNALTAQKVVSVVAQLNAATAYAQLASLIAAAAVRAAGRATGDSHATEGWYDVGEQGRERVYLPTGARVVPNHAMSGESNGSSSGGTVNNYHYWPAGSDSRSVVGAKLDYERRNAEFRP